jgi:hypothetical protein
MATLDITACRVSTFMRRYRHQHPAYSGRGPQHSLDVMVRASRPSICPFLLQPNPLLLSQSRGQAIWPAQTLFRPARGVVGLECQGLLSMAGSSLMRALTTIFSPCRSGTLSLSYSPQLPPDERVFYQIDQGVR